MSMLPSFTYKELNETKKRKAGALPAHNTEEGFG